MTSRQRPFVLVTFLFAATMLHAFAQTRRPLEVDDLARIQRISDPALSRDGKWIAYTVGTSDLKANRIISTLWIIGLDGSGNRRLATPPGNCTAATWSPDGKWIAFVLSRSGKTQIWLIRPDGSDATQFTHLSTDVSEPVWSPDGSLLAFVSDVFPEYSALPFTVSDSLNALRLDQLENGPVKARIFTHLLYRHWDEWVNGKRKHIFVQATGAPAEPRDLTPGDRDAVPTSSTFSAGVDFAFSPDGKEIAYTATPVPIHEEAWSTNHDIYVVPVAGGTPRQVTLNPAADGYPRYSPDGRFLAYRAQSVAGFEADRWQLMLMDRTSGTITSLTKSFDGSVGTFLWSPDGRKLYFVCDENTNAPLFVVSVGGNDVQKVVDGGSFHPYGISPDGKTLCFTHNTLTRPDEIYSAGTDGGRISAITKSNDSLFASLDIPEPESIWYTGDGGTRIQAWLLRPPRFDPARKYPFVYLVHGGPQGMWENGWSFRWNPVLWAAQGYVIMAPNPRGSTGFGQKFTNDITRDWGGKVYQDLLKGLDYAEALPYVNKDLMAAAGASFGGYMMNWFEGHCGDKFKTLVTHDGVYNFESMYGTTDEVWFDEWEHGGTPWDKPAEFRKFSPSAYAANFKTPMLIIHNELDYRVPLSEGMQLFTALQRKGIPSRMLYFPDEGHLVLKPANSGFWHKVVFDWLAEYLKK